MITDDCVRTERERERERKRERERERGESVYFNRDARDLRAKNKFEVRKFRENTH